MFTVMGSLFSHSNILHLRIPFSFFLFPVFFFALAESEAASITNILITFVSIHLFLYPASNAYNSYFDRDEGSIGGLKNPPRVEESLFYLSLLFDVVALAMALTINFSFFIMILIYGAISKAYSHPKIRLKKRPFAGLIIVSLFQGWFTFLMVYVGLNDVGISTVFTEQFARPGLLTSVLLLGSYPMTQIYQHEEDRNRGDKTISLILGVKGTFHFTAIVFAIATGLYVWYFSYYFPEWIPFVFIILLFPVLGFFVWWYLRMVKDPESVDYKNTMRLNLLSAVCLNIFFIYLNFI